MNRFYILLAALTLIGSSIYAQITTPYSASPQAEVTQTIGISTITVNYCRPAVHERVIWGELVPYGYNKQAFGLGHEAPWRSGANENTTITLSHPAAIGGKEVAAGTYGLFYVINEDNTGEVILSSDTKSWGSYYYDPDNDVLRAEIKLEAIPHTERLTYDFVNIDRTSATLVLDWEKKRFPVTIKFDVDEIVMENARQELKGTVGFSWEGYQSAAQYALQNGYSKLEEALAWSNTALQLNPAFNTYNLNAQILEKLGKTEEANAAREQSLIVATEAQLNRYGYQLMNAGSNEEAIRIFTQNTVNHPESANAWDSLGEACYNAGKKEEAKKHFEKALSLNPEANVRENSEKHLKLIGG
ncbi:MAG: DUF2911 domain-containing protein [Flavobacteriales bacterium]